MNGGAIRERDVRRRLTRFQLLVGININRELDRRLGRVLPQWQRKRR